MTTMADAEKTTIKIDLGSQRDDVDLQSDYWLIDHSVVTREVRHLLIEAHSAQSLVDVSLLFWPGDNTEFRCSAKVSKIAPKFRLDHQGPVEIPSCSRPRMLPQEQ